MRVFRNITFIVFTAIVTLLVISNIMHAALGSGYTIPSRSYLEGRIRQGVPEATPEALASGEFQSQAEQFLADRFPKRDGVLIRNAELQGMTIKLANLPFDYPALPTFFGSRYVYLPEWGSIQDIPFSQRDYPSKRVEAAAGKWASMMSAYPDSHWCFAMVDRAFTSDSSPAYKLIGRPADYQFFKERFSCACPRECLFIDLSCSSTEMYFSDYYHTDHHWQVQGATKAYRQIVTGLNREPKDFDDFVVVFDGPFFGSGVRSGLAPLASDVVYDVSYDTSNFSVSANGKDVPRSDVDEFLSDSHKSYRKPAKYANVYADYFHGDYGLLEYFNADAPEGSLLVIGDSYTNCMDRFFAENYQHVSVIDPRYCKNNLDAYVDELAPDDIVVLMSANNLIDKGILQKLG